MLATNANHLVNARFFEAWSTLCNCILQQGCGNGPLGGHVDLSLEALDGNFGVWSWNGAVSVSILPPIPFSELSESKGKEYFACFYSLWSWLNVKIFWLFRKVVLKSSLVSHMYVTIIMKPARENVKAIWLSPQYCVVFCFFSRFYSFL